jgi:hypothetical protein
LPQPPEGRDLPLLTPFAALALQSPFAHFPDGTVRTGRGRLVPEALLFGRVALKSEVQRILGEHRVLDHAAEQLENIVKGGVHRAPDAFHALSRFASCLAEHLVNEGHSGPQPELAGANDNSTTAAFQIDLEELQADWNEYLLTWDETRARTEWQAFSQHSLSILSRVRSRIERENELILRKG